MGTKVQAVTFDFWNTLFVEVAPNILTRRAEIIAATVDAGAAPITITAAENAVSEAWKEHRRRWAAGVRLTTADGAKHVAAHLNLRPVESVLSRLERAMEYMYDAEELTPCDALGPMLERLKAADLRIGTVCDTGFSPGRMLWDRLVKLRLAQLFDGASFSDEVGVFKPDPAIFEHSLRYLKSRPAATVHVGDLWRNDVCGARGAGFQAIRYCAWNDDKPTGRDEADYVSHSHSLTTEWILSRIS